MSVGYSLRVKYSLHHLGSLPGCSATSSRDGEISRSLRQDEARRKRESVRVGRSPLARTRRGECESSASVRRVTDIERGTGIGTARDIRAGARTKGESARYPEITRDETFIKHTAHDSFVDFQQSAHRAQGEFKSSGRADRRVGKYVDIKGV